MLKGYVGETLKASSQMHDLAFDYPHSKHQIVVDLQRALRRCGREQPGQPLFKWLLFYVKRLFYVLEMGIASEDFGSELPRSGQDVGVGKAEVLLCLPHLGVQQPCLLR